MDPVNQRRRAKTGSAFSQIVFRSILFDLPLDTLLIIDLRSWLASSQINFQGTLDLPAFVRMPPIGHHRVDFSQLLQNNASRLVQDGKMLLILVQIQRRFFRERIFEQQ